MVLRKIVFFVSILFFLSSSVFLFLFNSNAQVTLDSVSAEYVFPSSPTVIEVSGIAFSKPSIFSENRERVSLVAPSTFSEGSWSVYPTSLEPGLYYIFSGFSQSSFQIHYSLFNFPSNSFVNPLFWVVFTFFVVSSFAVLFLFIFMFKDFFKKSFRAFFFTSVSFFALIIGFVSFFAFMNIVNVASSLNVNDKIPLELYDKDIVSSDFSDSMSRVDPAAKYSLDDLESFLGLCLRPDKNNASMYSNNTACASSVFDYATRNYGPKGFAFLFSSDLSMFFNESCEFASRYSARHVLVEPVDPVLLADGLVCNFSWLNHLVSSSFVNFSNVYSFIDYSVSVCDSIGDIKEIKSSITRQQCSRGIGVGLFNLTRDTAEASSLCLDLSYPFDPQNCFEGVFLEAYNQLSSKKIYGIDSPPLVSLCTGVEPDAIKGCFRIIDKDLLNVYTVSDFKKYCLSLGASYESACAYATGHLAGQTVVFDDFVSLGSVCDFSDSFSCLDRFYSTQAVENSDKVVDIIDSCFTYVDVFSKDPEVCVNLTNFVNNVVSVKE